MTKNKRIGKRFRIGRNCQNIPAIHLLKSPGMNLAFEKENVKGYLRLCLTS